MMRKGLLIILRQQGVILKKSDALIKYNQYKKRKMLAAKLAKESDLVQEESMSVLAEFERICFGLQTKP